MGGQNRHDLVLEVTTTTATANQSVGTGYTPKSLTLLHVQSITIEVKRTTASATLADLGSIEVRWGTDQIIELYAVNPNSGAPFGVNINFASDIILEGDASKALDARCSPADTTSTDWRVVINAYVEGEE